MVDFDCHIWFFHGPINHIGVSFFVYCQGNGLLLGDKKPVLGQVSTDDNPGQSLEVRLYLILDKTANGFKMIYETCHGETALLNAHGGLYI